MAARCICRSGWRPDCTARHRDDAPECSRCGGMCSSRRQCDEFKAETDALIRRQREKARAAA